MLRTVQKVPFLLEIIFNGLFIFFYSLRRYHKVPDFFNKNFINGLIELGAYAVPFVILIVIFGHYLFTNKIEEIFRKYVFSLILVVPLFITWGDEEFAFWFSSIHLLSSILMLYENEKITKKQHKTSLLRMFKLQPAQIVLLTFLVLIFGGSVVLMLPISSANGEGLEFIDALFMATSATCVTGLSTVSVQGDLSFFGQVIILVLIQIGGLGTMILYSSMTILIGRSMAIKERVVMQDLLNVSSLEELISMIIDIVRYTVFIELWGVIFLTIAFTINGVDFSRALYLGVFHSISAFCNAGFSLFDNSLVDYASTPSIHFTISLLIILGGVGFIVIKEIKTIVESKSSLSRMGIHTKIVLITTSLLTLAGMFVIFFGEFLNALDQFTLWEKIQISFFQSVTLRTAGFNTIPIENFHSHTIYLISIFMFIGASPGSTGGGIKTTTLAVLIYSIRATLYGRDKVEIFDRTIPISIVVKTTALTIISMLLATLFIFVLMKIEPEQSFLSIFFEAISASGTVGLSLGITDSLSQYGKFILSFLMFIGRVGPLTLVLAIGQKSQSSGIFLYPSGRIMIG